METNNVNVPAQPSPRQSRPGIAAFISKELSVGVLLIYLISQYAYLHFGAPGNLPVPIFTIIVMVLGGILSLIGLVLGVVTLFRKGTKKILAIPAILGSMLVILLLMFSILSLFIFTA
jgi:hypothetical protein